MINRSILVVVHGLSLGIVGAVCVLLVGCGGYSRPSVVSAEYGDYWFSRWGDDKSFDAFGVNLRGVNHKPPSIEVVLPSGETFNCDSVTVEIAEKIFHGGKTLEEPDLGKKLRLDVLEDDPVAVVFSEGKFQSVTIQKGGKFRFAGQKEFIVLPISEEKMISLFGKPKEYMRSHGGNP
jgi:hypothetical protein